MLDKIKYVISAAFLAALLTGPVYAPPVLGATLLPNGEQTFVDANGTPLASGCVYFYTPGTNTPKDTYADPGGAAANTNPVVLDGAGRAIIYGVGTYRQVLKKYPCGVLGEQVWDQLTADTASGGVIFAGASAGTPDAITVVAPAFTGADGQVINYISTNTNTGGATFNPSGFGNVQIVRDGPSGPAALVGGELVATNAVSLIYDATAGVFHILSPITWPNTSGVPVGAVIPHAGFTAPTNYAFAYGQAINRVTFASLQAVLTSAQTGSLSSGTPTITGLSDTSQLGYGVTVEATGIPGGARIISCTVNTCTMDTNASITRSGTMTFYPYGAGDGSLTFNLPDYRGRGLIGRDNMGGTAANVTQVAAALTTTSGSPNATVPSIAGLAIGMRVISANVAPPSTVLSLPFTVASASVATGGSGGANGAVVLTVVGGTGTAATLNGTISGGALVSIGGVASAGLYTTLPVDPVTVTGGSLSGATVNLNSSRSTVVLSANATVSGTDSGARFSLMSDVQVLGSSGGAGTVVQNGPEVGVHNHQVFLNDPGHAHGYTSPAIGSGTGSTPNYFNSSSVSTTTSSSQTGITVRNAPQGSGAANLTAATPTALPMPILNPVRNVNYVIRLVP